MRVPVHARHEGVELLGTPIDITAQELRIECDYPADDATEAWFHSNVERTS